MAPVPWAHPRFWGTHGYKFSQHVLLQVMRSGGCYDEPCCLLAGLAAAHDVAARVVARCEQRGVPASTLVDFAVYHAGGCLGLLVAIVNFSRSFHITLWKLRVSDA